MAQEMVERVVDGKRRLLGLGQTIEVGQNRLAAVAQFEIQLAACAELQQVQGNAPPAEEARGVDAILLDARVGEAIQPDIELGEKMANGLN